MFRTPKSVCAAAIFSLTLAGAGTLIGDEQSGRVKLVRVPDQGIQPQVLADDNGKVHLVYFKGDPNHGDIFYTRSSDEGASFSDPIRVNSQEGSAVAAGTIRGAQLAVGEGERVHVAWNGSSLALPRGPRDPEQPKESPHNGLPMLYSRMNEAGAGFEPQRNLIQRTFGLDGGGSVAADDYGNVYVAWHGRAEGRAAGEAGRTVWVARSHDQGETFFPEAAAFDEPTGACGCCGMRVFADSGGIVYSLFRSAAENVNRDIYLLISRDQGGSFEGTRIDKWKINACPMSSMAMAEGAQGTVAAWETEGQVSYASIDPADAESAQPIPAPGGAKGRKHPALAQNAEGETILVWTEGTGWQKGGDLAWQVFDRDGHPTAEKGKVSGVPIWSFGAVFSRSDGGFTIVH